MRPPSRPLAQQIIRLSCFIWESRGSWVTIAHSRRNKATRAGVSMSPSQLLRRLVVLQPGEGPVLLASFATLLCTFTSYAILRPVRDALGVTSGLETIPTLFWAVFVVMLL